MSDRVRRERLVFGSIGCGTLPALGVSTAQRAQTRAAWSDRDAARLKGPMQTFISRTSRAARWSFVLPLALAACDSETEPVMDTLSPEALASVRAAAQASLASSTASGLSLAIWRDGNVIYREGFGTKNLEGDPVTPDTLFQIGSDTKKISAIALLQQVQAHALALEDTVGSLLPDLKLASDPNYFASLTVRDLLRQCTGLYDYAPWTEDAADADLAGVALGRFAANEYTLMPSGIAWDYSNPNYSLVGLLTERVSARSWPEIVNSDVLMPLGMQHSYARRDDVLAAETDIASGQGVIVHAGFDSFNPFDDPDVELGWVAPEEQLDNAFVRPAGLIWSTPADQARLLGFLVDGDEAVLSDPLRQAMQTKQAPVTHGSSVGYGYGLVVEPSLDTPSGEHYDVPFVWHDGGTLTMSSLSLMLPEQRVAVSVLANSSDADLQPVARAVLVAAARESLPEASPAPVPEPASDIPSYAGTYEDANLGQVTLRWDGAQLSIQSPVLDAAAVPYAHVLEPLAWDLFSWVVADDPTSISFYDGEDGTPHAYGVSRQFVLHRVIDVSAAQ